MPLIPNHWNEGITPPPLNMRKKRGHEQEPKKKENHTRKRNGWR
jgi:hypothetical protein